MHALCVWRGLEVGTAVAQYSDHIKAGTLTLARKGQSAAREGNLKRNLNEYACFLSIAPTK